MITEKYLTKRSNPKSVYLVFQVNEDSKKNEETWVEICTTSKETLNQNGVFCSFIEV